MKIAVCISDGGGMMFGGRRVSRDSALIRDLTATCGAEKILMHPYSVKLFEGTDVIYEANESFLDTAGKGALCFVENKQLARYAEDIDELIIYRWNRRYPFDMKLDIDPFALGFKLSSVTEFPGTSHDKITKEKYVK